MNLRGLSLAIVRSLPTWAQHKPGRGVIVIPATSTIVPDAPPVPAIDLGTWRYVRVIHSSGYSIQLTASYGGGRRAQYYMTRTPKPERFFASYRGVKGDDGRWREIIDAPPAVKLMLRLEDVG